MNKDLELFFRDEAQSLLLRINDALKQAQSRGSLADVINDLRRYAHTLKGAAHIADRADVAQEAHELESLIEEAAVAGDQAKGVSRALLFSDRIAELLSSAGTDQVAAATGNASGGSHQAETLHIELQDVDEILRQLNSMGNVISGVRRALANAEKLKGALEEMTELPGSSSQQRDALFGATQQAVGLGKGLQTTLETFERDLATVRKRIQDLRLVPANYAFIFVERAVRAASEATSKQVRFETVGGEIELDGDILFQLKDALVQIGKNAVAHGIESPTERRARGKDAVGMIKLWVSRRGRRITFALTDDGVGIDFLKLRRRAVERGWLSREAAEKADVEQLTSLILRPGVTTSSEVTQVSGRGVGLDLVSEMVARLKGQIRIRSEAGKGTAIELEVPSTVTSLPVLIAKAGSVSVGLPSDSVLGTVLLEKVDRVNDAYIIDGRALLFVALADFIKAKNSHPRIGIRISASPPYLLGVDSVVGIEDAKVHLLPAFVESEPYVLGLSLKPGENPCLIVDPVILREVSDANPNTHDRKPSRRLPILIVDDSLTTRMLEQSIFTAAGYEVEMASSGEEALALAQKNQFGLFVVDVEMPGMDGFEFVARTQQQPALRGIPAVMVTSRASEEDRQRGMNAGAKEFFSKAKFDQKALLRRVSELLEEK